MFLTRRVAFSPAKIFVGDNALSDFLEASARHMGKTALLVGKQSWEHLGAKVDSALKAADLPFDIFPSGSETTLQNVDRLCELLSKHETVVGVGGGKVMDSAKLVAQRLGIPAFMIPTSAATCAAFTPLSNVYNENGGWTHGVPLEAPPEGLVLDHHLIATAPPRLLASGIADAMAKLSVNHFTLRRP